MATEATKHEIKHRPATGTGYGVCECGATIRMKNGAAVGTWHTCGLCTHLTWHDPPRPR